MIIFAWIVILSSAVDAVPYPVASNATNASDVGQQGHGLVDCRYYITPDNSSLLPSPMSFEDYWCQYWDDQYPCQPDECPNAHPYLWNLNGTTQSFCLALEKSDYSRWVATHPASITEGGVTESAVWQPVTTPPCCDTECILSASAAQLLYWPTPASNPEVKTITSNGYTFISPSVYVVFKNIAATGDCGVIGPKRTTVTKAYAPSEIKSYVTGNNFGTADPMNYADLWSNCTSRDASYLEPTNSCDTVFYNVNAACSTQQDEALAKYYRDIKHCYPVLEYPVSMGTIYTAWATCQSAQYGGYFPSIFDPPRTLAPANALGPVPTKESNNLATALPASIVSSTIPAKTGAPGTAGVSPTIDRSDDSLSHLRPSSGSLSASEVMGDPRGSASLYASPSLSGTKLDAAISGGVMHVSIESPVIQEPSKVSSWIVDPSENLNVYAPSSSRDGSKDAWEIRSKLQDENSLPALDGLTSEMPSTTPTQTKLAQAPNRPSQGVSQEDSHTRSESPTLLSQSQTASLSDVKSEVTPSKTQVLSADPTTVSASTAQSSPSHPMLPIKDTTHSGAVSIMEDRTSDLSQADPTAQSSPSNPMLATEAKTLSGTVSTMKDPTSGLLRATPTVQSTPSNSMLSPKDKTSSGTISTIEDPTNDFSQATLSSPTPSAASPTINPTSGKEQSSRASAISNISSRLNTSIGLDLQWMGLFKAAGVTLAWFKIIAS